MCLSLKQRIAVAWNCLCGRVPGERIVLPNKRENETIKFRHGNFTWYATIGRFEDGKLAEIFLSTAKSGELLRAMANDAATASSLALQYGCPLEKLKGALARDTGNAAATPLAAALDKVEQS